MADPAKSYALLTMQALDAALFPCQRRKAPHAGWSNHQLASTLRALIRGGARFDLGDMAEINRLGSYSTMGVFNPLDISTHRHAVLWGNATAAASWDAAVGWDAWRYPGKMTVPTVSVHDGNYRSDWRGRRVATSSRMSLDTALFIDGAVWRVYAMERDVVKLVHHDGDDGDEFTIPIGRGGRRWRPDRAEWAEVCKRNRLTKTEVARG